MAKVVRSNLKLILDDRPDLTIRKLAEQSGLKFETVRRLYHDQTVQFHRKSIAQVCDTLKIDISELLYLDNED